jgi:uncharacterized protein YhbP (UPF0306 family)
LTKEEIEDIRARGVLEEYVSAGKLMQVATLSEDGRPALCNVWYNFRFGPDRLYFISRPDRDHSVNIRSRRDVAGGIVDLPLTGLGQKVTGVTFKGTATELDTNSDDEIAAFVARWPGSRAGIQGAQPASRLYRIDIIEWVLFDDNGFPDAPRRVLSAALQ